MHSILCSSLLMFLLFTACSQRMSTLTVHTDYISHENLASYYVKTPDPRLNNPSIGQRLVVSWSVPKKLLKLNDLHLEMTLRYRNREECLKIIPITESSGTYVYSLMNDDYIATRGILTYKIDLLAGQELIERWLHQIWTELILIEHSSSPTGSEDLDKDFEVE